MEYRSASTHIEDLADGSQVAPGEAVSLTQKAAEDPHNARLINEGILIEASAPYDERVAAYKAQTEAAERKKAEAEKAKGNQKKSDGGDNK
jgi:hypothetical protein